MHKTHGHLLIQFNRKLCKVHTSIVYNVTTLSNASITSCCSRSGITKVSLKAWNYTTRMSVLRIPHMHSAETWVLFIVDADRALRSFDGFFRELRLLFFNHRDQAVPRLLESLFETFGQILQPSIHVYPSAMSSEGVCVMVMGSSTQHRSGAIHQD